jgi:hypothetical protein
VSMQARGSLGPLLEIQVKPTSQQDERSSAAVPAAPNQLRHIVRKHAGLRAVSSDCVLAGVKGNVMLLIRFVLPSSPAVLAVHGGCSASVASTATEITKLWVCWRAFSCAPSTLCKAGRTGLFLARNAPLTTDAHRAVCMWWCAKQQT